VATVLMPKPFDWIDRAVGPQAKVGLLWPADNAPTWVWQEEIWNRSLRSVVAVDGPMPVLETLHGSFSKDTGVFVPTSPGDAPREDLFVAPSRWVLDGTEVARGRAPGVSLVVWRVNRPLRLRFQSTGIYDDGWTGKDVELSQYGCSGGAFRLKLWRGFGSVQSVVVTSSGRSATTVRVSNTRPRSFTFPAAPDPATGRCSLHLDVTETATGTDLGAASDPRVLGLHIVSPTFDSTAKA
jgi:hypothetical protein